MMKRYLRKLSIVHFPLFISAALLVACSEDITTQTAIVEEGIPINIASTYPVAANTRATIDNGFVSGDAVGIFVVDYDSNGKPGTLLFNGERKGNICFTYDGSKWTANYQLYWKNKTTPADIYGYYPYDQTMENTEDYVFTINSHQDGDASSTAASGYEASDLLRAKTEKVSPTTETVNLQYNHLMAGVTVTLEMGTGFEATEWANLAKTVQIENAILTGSVNLATGVTTVSEDAKAAPITPLLYNNTWRAIVFPQTIAAGKTVASVTVDGHSYQLVKNTAITYQSGKMHKMSIKVDRSAETGAYTFSLIDDDIVAWIDDPALHDGLVFQYVIVRTTSPGTLQQVVDNMGIKYEDLRQLKLEGPLNGVDLDFIQSELLNTECVNMAKVELAEGVLRGFGDNHRRLRHFVFPERGVKTIDARAFAWTALSGTIVIPEGVENIEFHAFADIHTGYNRVVLPSTIKKISSSFSYSDFHADLRLPEGIVSLDSPGIYFEGNMYLPSSLEVINGMGMPDVTGTIVIPSKITKLSSFCFSDCGCTQVEFHDGITEIGSGAFIGSMLTGELVLPPNLKSLGDKAFAETRIRKIIFPKSLQMMHSFQDEGVFANCKYLTGTLELPPNVSRIPCGCFRGCTAITGLIIPEGVDVIEDAAFKDCYSLNSIIVKDEEPPVLYNNTFLGVPKDNFTVEVPKGCVEKYREAPGWKEFKRIAEYSNFVCRPMQANALNTAHTEQLILNADGAWQVDRCPDWVTLSKTSGTGKTELTLTFKQMAHGSGNRTDSIIFKMPSENYRSFCVVSQYDYEQEEDSYIALQTHSKGRGIDVVFMGDGYDGEDISNGNYLNLVKQQAEHFFDLEPYKSHRDYFNVYVTFPLSQEKGVNTMNTYVNNHFGTLYGYDGQMCTSNQLLTEVDEVRDYAVAHSPLKQDDLRRSLIILVPNSDAYSGVTYFEWYGSPISICPPSNRPYPQDTRGVVQHEAGGHGFGRLGDEEIIYSAWAPSSVKGFIEDKHGSGEYANLATTSGLHSVPWADFIFDTRYSDYVDVFEGGLSYMRGVFRPEQNSCMNYGIPYYNAPSRLSIMRRIFDYAGEGFSMDYFYDHDSKAWGASSRTRAAGEAFSGSSYAGSNQHRMPTNVDGKKMGNSVRRILNNIKNKNKK